MRFRGGERHCPNRRVIFVTRQIPTTAAVYGVATRPASNRSVPLANTYRKTARAIVPDFVNRKDPMTQFERRREV